MLFFVSLISATSIADGLGTFKQNENITIVQVCEDATYINITSISYPNSSIAVLNVAMINDGEHFYYYFSDTEDFGRYDVRGVSDGCTQTFVTYFKINYSGKELSSSQSTIYIGLLGILIFVLFASFFSMGFLPASNTKDEEGRILQVSYLKYLRLPLWLFCYFLFTAIIYLSSNLAFVFLEEQLFANFLLTIFKILLGIAPVIIVILVISFFVKFFHDKEFQNLLNRGLFPEYNL